VAAVPARRLVLLAAVVLLAACGSSSSAGSTSAAGTLRHPARVAPSAATRVAVIVMENHELGEIVGSHDAPYLTSLARRGALATQYFAITHPSLPNYVALISGSTHGIASDCPASACSVSGPSIVDQLEARHVPWRAYMEGMPHPCFYTSGDTVGEYAQRHDPFMYMRRVRARRSWCSRVVPFARLAADERRGLPRFAWITPNLCDDMHDCPVATGDRWLRAHVPALLRALGRHGLLLVTFDEGTSDRHGGGRVATIAAGGLARPGARWGAAVSHYGLLATVEDLLGLPRLGHARAARPLTGLLR